MDLHCFVLLLLAQITRFTSSGRIWCQKTPPLQGRLPARRLGGANTRKKIPTSSAPLSRRRPPSTGRTGRKRTPGASEVAGTLGVAEIAGRIGTRDGEIGVVVDLVNGGVEVEVGHFLHLEEVELCDPQFLLLLLLATCSPTWLASPLTSLPLTLK